MAIPCGTLLVGSNPHASVRGGMAFKSTPFHGAEEHAHAA